MQSYNCLAKSERTSVFTRLQYGRKFGGRLCIELMSAEKIDVDWKTVETVKHVTDRHETGIKQRKWTKIIESIWIELKLNEIGFGQSEDFERRTSERERERMTSITAAACNRDPTVPQQQPALAKRWRRRRKTRRSHKSTNHWLSIDTDTIERGVTISKIQFDICQQIYCKTPNGKSVTLANSKQTKQPKKDKINFDLLSFLLCSIPDRFRVTNCHCKCVCVCVCDR